MNCNKVLGACAAIAATLLAGCGSHGTVTIADSQSADSQTTDYAIAFIKRTVPMTGTGATATLTQDDLRLRRAFFGTANLYLLNPTSAGGAEINVTASITGGGGVYDIKDVDVNYDGSSVLFALRGPVTAKQKSFSPPNWGIWEYVVASKLLHQVCPTEDPTCSKYQYISPHYLPDGRILFATTRQYGQGAVLLNEGKPEFENQTEALNESAFELHVMNADGSGLHQITYNMSHDVDASVLQSGRILFSRWDDANSNGGGIHLYTSNPDGSNVQLLYGYGSHVTSSTNPAGATSCPAGEDCTVQFVSAREMPSGQVLALVRPFTNADWGGNLEILDVEHYIENNQANPDTPNNDGASMSSVGAQAATSNAVLTACTNSCSQTGTGNLPLISPGGRFTSAFPLWDGTGRILVTWSECRLQNSTGTILPCTSSNLADTTLLAAPPLYSAWMFDPSSNTFLPITTPTSGVFVNDIVSLQPRPTAPNYIPDSYTPTSNPDGILDIRSVYDWDGAVCNGQNGESCNVAGSGGISAMAQTEADHRPVRFLRLVKAVSIPPAQAATGQALKFDQNVAFGAAGNYMREIMGYVPIEPDGSVVVTVPAQVAFQVDVVDLDPVTGWVWRAFPLHKAWLQLQPGETLACNGCHLPTANQQPAAGASYYSHGGATTLFDSVWSGSAGAGPFPGTSSGDKACQAGQTMAEALANCIQPGNMTGNPAGPAKPSVNVVFNDNWFSPPGGPGSTGNGSFDLTYDDPTFTTPLPTLQACALPNGWSDFCRVVINYPTTAPATATVPVSGNIEPLWDKCRMADGSVCPSGTMNGAGTCSGCHNASTLATGYLDLTTKPSANNNAVENSYAQLMNPFSVQTGVDPVTGQPILTQERPAEFVSGNSAGSPFFQYFESNTTHMARLSAAEMRLLSEWVDIGAQYFNNPFNAPAQ